MDYSQPTNQEDVLWANGQIISKIFQKKTPQITIGMVLMTQMEF